MTTRNYWTRMKRSRMSRRSLLRASARAGVGAAGLALVGCGDDDDDGQTAAQVQQQAEQQEAMAEQQAQQQDQQDAAQQQQQAAVAQAQAAGPAIAPIYNAGLHLNTTGIDPHTGTSGTDAYYFQPFYDYLVMHDTQNNQLTEISLAEAWEFPDNTTIIFSLRDGVTFHNGDSFTSEDVRLNLERVTGHPASTPKANFEVVHTVETPDERTATYLLSEPSAAVMHLLGDRAGAMIHVPTADELGDEYGLNPVGTGPYSFVEWVDQSHVLGKRNPDHWMLGPAPGSQTGSPVPYFNELKYNIITENSTLIATGLAGDLDTMFIPEPQFNAQVEEHPDWRIVEMQGAFVSEILVFNSKKPPLDNMSLRLAIMHAVHPEAVNQAVHNNLMIQALGGQWPNGTLAYSEVPSNPQVAYPAIADRRARAQEYLAQSGVDVEALNAEGGISLTTYVNQVKIDASQAYANQIKEVLGLQVNFEPLELVEFIPAFFENGEYHMTLTGWSRYPEPDWIASLAYTESGVYNPTGAQDVASPIHPDLDQLVSDGRSTFDVEERREIYGKINDIIVGEGHFYTMLYGVNFTGVRNAIQNAEETLFNGEGKWQTRWLHSDEA
ncbi:MAG: ABC transporter substrate-binding protein [Chloroflexi bacterium]|nr:ABC transporter substrate-binding protein [Chloroflexota bacterium]MCY3695733.1 ABC transporter substrate-binding protein [Chloroflexota bacterium]MXX79616.1 ABC transporter substrate-binding protein [Chloroflexota bacterium]MYF22570.1 ABC transporter substrate-binding protein [Chloroflexota bacterium]